MHPSLFQGKTTVKLNIGIGLVGLLGANLVILTNVVVLNWLSRRMKFKELVWSTTSLDEVGLATLVLMSDLFYDSELMSNLAWMLKGLSNQGTTSVAAI